MKFSQAKPQHIIRELKLEGLAEPHLSGQQGCTRGRIPTGVASGSKRWENIHSLTQQIFIEELLLARHCARSFCWLAMRQTEVFEAITDNENKSCLTKFSTLWLQKPSWKISLYQASVSVNVLIVVVIDLSNKLSFSYWIILCVLSVLIGPTLCDPVSCSPPGSSVHGIFQAWRIWRIFSIEYSPRIWSGLPFPPLRDLSNTGIKTAPPVSPPLQVDSLPLHHLGSHWIIRNHFWRNTNLLLIIGIENILFLSIICPLCLYMAEADIHCSVI